MVKTKEEKQKEKQTSNELFFEIKKNFVEFCHELKSESMKEDLTKQTALVGLRQLVKNGDLTTKELRELWNNGKTMLKSKKN